ncbi:hypothetical protein [Dactylosporangium sp. NPDC050588]|uniref:hypothetical protein n=1 Tax=Dactylosporangium sp. NPDC050588 TaxID=3157211 RepID=UPI0033BFDE96
MVATTPIRHRRRRHFHDPYRPLSFTVGAWALATAAGSSTEYASSPAPFWMVKPMDLGIIAPIATATGIPFASMPGKG